MAAPRLLDPSRLAPVPVDMRRVFLVGIALWLVALAVSGVLLATGTVGLNTVVTCATGAALGGLALLWARRRGPQA